MAMAASEIEDVIVLEFKSSDVSMDESQEDLPQALDSFNNETPALTMETSTRASSTASLHDDYEGASDNDLEELVEIDESSVASVIEEICPEDGPCIQCEIEQPCSFRFTNNRETLYVCNEPCIKAYQAKYPGKYTVTRKKYIIEEISPKTLLCSECEEKKTCYFYHNFHGEDTFYCSLNCLEVLMSDEKDKYTFSRNSLIICIDQIRPIEGQCLICEKVKPCEFSLVRYGEHCFLCERTCIKILSERERVQYYIKKLRVSKPVVSNAIDKNLDEGYKIQENTAARVQREQSFHRRCSQCTMILMIDENVLTWEAMDFCNEICLERFQNGIGSRCAKCNNLVQHTSLGKYCVRFGFDIRQFCDSSCLEEFKKGLKICFYCQRDISTSTQVFLAPVGDNGQLKDFCTQSCVEKFDQMSTNPVPQPVWAKCVVCSLEKATTIQMEVTETASHRICSDPCFAAYKFGNNILPDQCKWCKKYFERKSTKSFTYDDSNPNCFCSQSCMTIYINHTKFIATCNWCKLLKYNFDMIRRRVDNGQVVMMCSLNCMSLYQESANELSSSKSVSMEVDTPARLESPAELDQPAELDLLYKSSHSVPSPAAFQVCESRRLARRRQRPLGDDKIYDVPNFGIGSEEEDVSGSEDEDALTQNVPRGLRIFHEPDVDTAPQEAIDSVLVDNVSVPPVKDVVNEVGVEDMNDPQALFDFNWHEFPTPPVAPEERRERFVGSHGPTTEPSLAPYDVFVLIWDRQVMEGIVRQTNLYAQQYAGALLARGDLKPNSRIVDWKDTNVEELYIFFALLMAMGITVKSKLDQYWTTDKNIFTSPGFSAQMPIRRFQLLSRCLHFNDNRQYSPNVTRSEAKIQKIKPIVEHLNCKFQGLYGLGQNIALDESLTQWKGWLDIKQYIPNKASTVGIKTYEVCDSLTGYLWRFEIHSGGESEAPEAVLSGSISNLVLRLLQGLNNRGHTVWMDNYYNSPALARLLKMKGIDCVGTLRTNRQFVPEQIKNLKKSDMTMGQVCGYTSGDVDVMVWRDQNRVAMISTYHGTAVSDSKPILIKDYNVCMGGVDKKDQMLAMYPMERKRTQVWYKKFFRRLLNVSILNAYIIYKHNNATTTHRAFRMELVIQILQRHQQRPIATLLSGREVPKFSAEVLAHYPVELPPPSGDTTLKARKSCVVCKKRTQSMCRACDVPLCFNFKPNSSCHIKYHT